MLVGELPFKSPYYDHKRRERLLRYALKGLSANHIEAISPLSPGSTLLDFQFFWKEDENYSLCLWTNTIDCSRR